MGRPQNVPPKKGGGKFSTLDFQGTCSIFFDLVFFLKRLRMKLVTTQPYFWVGFCFWGSSDEPTVVTTTGFYLCSFHFFLFFFGVG